MSETMSANPYWGAPSSNIDWCERNYAWSRYVAEPVNSLSALCMFFVGVRGLTLSYYSRHEKHFLVGHACVIWMGLGSILFHMTLAHWAQAIDEIAMVLSAVYCGYAAVMNTVQERKEIMYTMLVAFTAVFLLAYFQWPRAFVVFGIVFGAMSTCSIIMTYRMREKDDSTFEKLFWRGPGSFLCIVFGLWLPENLLCSYFPRVFQCLHLHAWWHVGAAIVTFYWGELILHCRLKQNKKL